MNPIPRRPRRLPDGVNASLWNYANTERLATEEDDYFGDHPLFESDAYELDARFTKPGPLIDLGCGSGRHAIRFAEAGFSVTAVDLSHAMLRKVREKSERRLLDIRFLKANLCDLRCIPDSTFPYAISMFSTLGMIRGRASRRRALSEAFRLLEPGGVLALHAHNLWLNLRVPGGPRKLLGGLIDSLAGRAEFGDRRMLYRGIPDMEVHLFRWSELKKEIISAGFHIKEVVPLHEITARPISTPGFLHPLRAGGWIVFAERPSIASRLH